MILVFVDIPEWTPACSNPRNWDKKYQDKYDKEFEKLIVPNWRYDPLDNLRYLESKI